ncbi:MAG: Clp protease ClpP [Fibrobacteres bacterium]|nr:Clp protease ClpP [Fibrobacterota bacterium]
MPDLLIYGAIGWDVSAIDTVREISKARGQSLNVRVNSPGGYVWEGLAIANAIRGHGSASTFVDGLAASMGSVIFLAGSRRVMAEGSRLMIHNPTSFAGGESDDLRKEADVLDGIADDMAQMYSDATGGKVSKKKCIEMMDAETWLGPAEAVEMGFAHAVEGRATAWAKIPAP